MCVHGALRLSFQRSQEKGKAGFQARGKSRGGEEGAVVKIFGFALAILLFKLLATSVLVKPGSKSGENGTLILLLCSCPPK
jgi:hypothetical protein